MGPVNVAGLASPAMVSGGKPAVRHPGGVSDVVTAVRILGPVSCTISPLVLRVRVPRDRPGVPALRPQLDGVQLRRQGLTLARTAGGAHAARSGV